jgi:hypothetical protein
MVFGRVYTIRSRQTNELYIGSTTQALSMRIAQHRRNYKGYLNKTQKYITSFKILQYNDAYIELLFEGEFESKDALQKREGEYIRSMECVNRCIAGRTKQEYRDENKEQILERNKKYYEDNKEQIIEHQKQYYEENKEQILKYHNEYYYKNKDKISEHGKQYRDENKYKIAEHNNQKFTCECGGHYTHVNIKKHEQTLKHQKFLENK